uniref:Putative lipocalin n=1 Tax=Ixodes ricinus TaxID=34613 RepID=A0A6B0UZF3_IXORI
MLVEKLMRAWMFFVLALLGNAIEKRNWLNATFAAMQQVEQYLKTTDSIYYVYQGTKATDPMKREEKERSGDTFRCPYMRIREEETTPHGYKSTWVTRVSSKGPYVRQWQLSLVLEKSGNYSTYNFFSVNERDLLKSPSCELWLKEKPKPRTTVPKNLCFLMYDALCSKAGKYVYYDETCL